MQQLTRLGLGQTVNYIVYLEEDVPKKIVLKQKANAKGDEAFKFITELSVPAYYNITIALKPKPPLHGELEVANTKVKYENS